MKKLFVILGFIGILNTLSPNPSVGLTNPGKKNKDEHMAALNPVIAPIFSQLDGNLFLAVKVPGSLKVDDGTVVEFVFDGKPKMISFHINDINQNLIDSGEADLFVMIHHDLALLLKSTRLKELHVINGSDAINVPVGKFWIPGENLAQL